jgi:hypothetical protein
MSFVCFVNVNAQNIPTNGLIAYWPFNGNANDASGNGNNGTVNGATLTTDRFGNANSAYSFNGTSNSISIPANASFTQNPISYSFWFNKVGSGNPCSGSEMFQGIFSTGSYGQSRDVILYQGATHYMGIQKSIPSGCANESYVYTNYVLNNWNHAVVTYETGLVKVYLNGVYMGSSAVACTNLTANTVSYIGASNPSIWACIDWFNGKIDDLAIYNRVITQDEITSLYNSNICYQSVTVTDTLIINTGILSYNPFAYNNTITIFPNPAKDHITIDCGTLSNVSGYSIKITNTLGQEVFNQPMNQQQYYVPLNSWTGQGMYFVNVIDAQGHTIDVKKIILQ